MKKWEQLSSTYLMKEQWITLRSDSYRTPKGDVIEPYYLREFPDWVGCLTFDSHLNVIMLKQYRPGADDFITEIPAGAIEPSDPSPQAAARRELEEEIGYQGGEIIALGQTWANPAAQTNRVHAFIALGGQTTTQTAHEIHETITMGTSTLPELLADISAQSDAPKYQGLHLGIILQGINFINTSSHPDAVKLRQQLS